MVLNVTRNALRNQQFPKLEAKLEVKVWIPKTNENVRIPNGEKCRQKFNNRLDEGMKFKRSQHNTNRGTRLGITGI